MTKRAASPARAHRPAADPVTAGDVAAWLKAARAPEPFAGASACAGAADLVNDYQRALAAWDDMRAKDAETARAFDEAHKAVLALRRTLPIVLARYADATSAPSILGGEQARREGAQRTAEAARMLAALVDVPKWPSALPFMHGWHDLAAALFLDFQRITGEGSTSRNGAAVRFIREGLKAAGVHVSPAAVEGALERSEALTARAIRQDRKLKT
jgi:hypothetical protein